MKKLHVGITILSGFLFVSALNLSQPLASEDQVSSFKQASPILSTETLSKEQLALATEASLATYCYWSTWSCNYDRGVPGTFAHMCVLSGAYWDCRLNGPGCKDNSFRVVEGTCQF